MEQSIRTKYLIITGDLPPLLCGQTALAQEPAATAATLRARYVELSEALETSTIQKGLHVESAESSQAPRGDAYAIVNYPFATVADAFTTPADTV